ncbi:hypothetical protein V2J09_007794 [Rumex salicifolius]
MASSSVSISHIYLPKTSKTLPPFPLSCSNFGPFSVTAVRFRSVSCSAEKQPRSGSVKSNQKRKKKKGSSGGGAPKERGLGFGGLEVLEDRDNGGYEEEEDDGESDVRASRSQQGYVPPPLPKPPAGFVVDDQGRVLMASSKRIITVVDPTNNLPLECTIRRIFTSSKGAECMLLCPVDMPIEIVKNTSDGWAAVSDEEIEAILPTADYALARIHMHLNFGKNISKEVHLCFMSPPYRFCFTARGGFCYSEDSIMEFVSEGETTEGMSTEGVEITCFHLDGSHYMMYTPSDPLLFVAVKDESGHLQIIDDELLDDPNIISAIDEETEFDAFVEEEIALLESLLGER